MSREVRSQHAALLVRRHRERRGREHAPRAGTPVGEQGSALWETHSQKPFGLMAQEDVPEGFTLKAREGI